MTTPRWRIFENTINEDLALREQYRQHQTCVFLPVREIEFFEFRFDSEIYAYRGGKLTVSKQKPHPTWQAPREYLRIVNIPMTFGRKAAIRRALRDLRKRGPRTDPESFMNYMKDGFIEEVFLCGFRTGESYRFVFREPSRETEKLRELLRGIAAKSPEYRQLEQMKKRIFDPRRWERLNLQTPEGE